MNTLKPVIIYIRYEFYVRRVASLSRSVLDKETETMKSRPYDDC